MSAPSSTSCPSDRTSPRIRRCRDTGRGRRGSPGGRTPRPMKAATGAYQPYGDRTRIVPAAGTVGSYRSASRSTPSRVGIRRSRVMRVPGGRAPAAETSDRSPCRARDGSAAAGSIPRTVTSPFVQTRQRRPRWSAGRRTRCASQRTTRSVALCWALGGFGSNMYDSGGTLASRPTEPGRRSQASDRNARCQSASPLRGATARPGSERADIDLSGLPTA